MTDSDDPSSSKITQKVREAAREKREARQAAGLSATSTPLEYALEDPTSRAKAIRAMCWQCQGEDADPHWQWRTGNCAIPRCALYHLRPYQSKEGTPVPPTLQ